MRTSHAVRIGLALAAFAVISAPVLAQTPAPTPPAAGGRPPVTSGEYTGPKHISDAIIGQNASGFAEQASSEKWKRSATLPEDWNYKLAPGVTTKQVSFYVDGGTRLQGKVFYPNGFDP